MVVVMPMAGCWSVQSQLDLKAARKVAGAEDDSSIGRRGAARTSMLGNLGRSGENV
jgi:hypothetical protein